MHLGVPLAISFGAFGVGCALAIGLLGALVIGVTGAVKIVGSDLRTLVRNSIPFLGTGLGLFLILFFIDLAVRAARVQIVSSGRVVSDCLW